MIAAAVVLTGYVAVIAAGGWLGVAAVALHVGLLVLGAWRPGKNRVRS